MKVITKMAAFVAAAALTVAFTNALDNTTAIATAAPGKVAVATASATTFNVNTANSALTWEGHKVAYGHTGTIKLSEGTLSIEGGNITAGSFTLDMNTITDTDITDKGKAGGLDGHLKSADFFHTEKFPTAKFDVVAVAPVYGDEKITHQMIGNLTIRGIARLISIPVAIANDGKTLTATTPTFAIDRTVWDISYSSSTAGAAADKAIGNNIGVSIKLEAAAK